MTHLYSYATKLFNTDARKEPIYQFPCFLTYF